MNTDQTVTAQLINEQNRLSALPRHFGRLMMRFERTVYSFVDYLSGDYKGGFWEYYELSNGGFFMAPRRDHTFRVSCDNGFQNELSGEAMGIVACLYALSHLSFDAGTPESVAEYYNYLRDFAEYHAEAALIFWAID